MAKIGKKAKAATVAVTAGDVREMRRSTLALTPAGVKAGAKARAAGRELFIECGSTVVALRAMTSGIPKLELERACRDLLKAA